MKTLISLLMLAALLAAPAARSQDCALTGPDMTALAALDYDAFNYGSGGWRKLTARGCYYEAGASIVSWLVDHESTMSADEQRTQHYQAARNFALAGRKPVALVQLRMARTPESGPNSDENATMDWNAFLDAFSAWLSADRAALNTALLHLAMQNPAADGRKPNLAAAQRFVRCWNRSYIEIEHSPGCLTPPAKESHP